MPDVDNDSPFTIAQAVDSARHFWGRAKQIQFILEHIRNCQCISLVGPSRVGKTSLLNYVSDRDVRARHDIDPSAALFVRLEGKQLANSDQATCLRRFTECILGQAEKADAALTAELRSCLQGRSRGHLGLRTLFRVLSDHGRQPVVTLDDFDDLAHNPKLEDSFFAALRSLATGCQVAYVVASQEPLYELEAMRPEASTLCGICRQLTLSSFSEQESRELLMGLLGQARVTLPESMVEFILRWGRNEPWRLQLAGYEAFQVWQENRGHLRGSNIAELERRIDRAAGRWTAA
jgi:hypothetical protein